MWSALDDRSLAAGRSGEARQISGPVNAGAFPFFFCTDYDTQVVPLNSARDATPLVAGDHLYAQTVQTFRYLQKRLAAGEIVMPSNALALGSFGQHAKQADGAAD
ncbi:MAG: hypothetical protein JOY90_18225 [Bradyrhizobium sp.]|uniref:hypothetical protein n=1 Tax=Bradyrhizobium sp. TaxID=376 RepID=UPI001DFA900F|nr:hypothetical protein [Bradyrhizobium sp.]MBV9562359.1 hypothetical protein [Bradyrhizobium sp.]